jgi:hypothetical protein
MRTKGSKEKKGVKKIVGKMVAKKKKVSTRAKNISPKKKKAEKGKVKIEKKKTTRKTLKKETKKVKAKVKKKKVVGKIVKKETKKVKVRKEGKAKKKKVTIKTKKKVTPTIEKKVAIKKTPQKPSKIITAREVPLPKKAVPKRPKEVLRPEKEKRYPPLPIEILPEEYGEDSIALMTVDPMKLFIYWEVREDTLKKNTGNLTIRIYDVTGIDFNGTNSKSYFDISVKNRLGSWYINVYPEKAFIADVGIIDPAGVFITIARSNKVTTPRAEVAEARVLPPKLYETGLPKGPPIGYDK